MNCLPKIERRYLVRVLWVSVVIAGATMLTYFWTRSWGWSSGESQTAAVTMLAIGQAAYLFNARSLRDSSLRRGILTENMAVWASIAGLLVVQAIFVYAPFMNNWFGSEPLPLIGWLLPLGLSVVVFLIVEAGKAIERQQRGAAADAIPGNARRTSP